jgi:hypothetical protein
LVELGFGIPEVLPNQKVRSIAQKKGIDESYPAMQPKINNTNFGLKTLTSPKREKEVFLPCERCPIQSSSDTMLSLNQIDKQDL